MCSCGCEMVEKKDSGGKVTSTCSCNCKGGKLKKEEGGLLNKVSAVTSKLNKK